MLKPTYHIKGTDAANCEMSFSQTFGVSKLGLGCMRMPMRDGEINRDAFFSMVDAAISNGINLFDTAPLYCKGRSEEFLGQALSRHPREAFKVSTKMSNFMPDQWSFDDGKRMFETSLRRLNVESIDFYALHAVGMHATDLAGNVMDGLETLEKRFVENGLLQYLLDQRAAGRIGALGFSFHGEPDVLHLLLDLHKHVGWDFAQISLNYVGWELADILGGRSAKLADIHRAITGAGIPVIAFEPLLGGRLADLPQPAASLLGNNVDSDEQAAFALRFAATIPQVQSVLSNMTTTAQLRNYIHAFSPFSPLSRRELETARLIADSYANRQPEPANL